MRTLGRVWGWLRWVNATLVLLVVSALVAYLGVLSVSSIVNVHQAIKAAQTASQTASTIATNAHSRINQFQSQITHLERQIQASGRQRSRQIGKLEAKVRVLIRQVRGLGGTPVVTERVVTVQHSKTKRVIVQPTPRPRPRPTVTVTPSPQPTCAIGVCLPRSRQTLPGQAPKLRH